MVNRIVLVFILTGLSHVTFITWHAHALIPEVAVLLDLCVSRLPLGPLSECAACGLWVSEVTWGWRSTSTCPVLLTGLLAGENKGELQRVFWLHVATRLNKSRSLFTLAIFQALSRPLWLMLPCRTAEVENVPPATESSSWADYSI